MMMLCMVFLVVFALSVTSECPNACNAHGKCGAYDMCICYRNWMANDCSQRICQFGMSHVDTPKGDLDSSKGYLSGPDTTVVINSDMYPCGTTEQYPNFVDSSGQRIDNSGHEYSECSNKGYCDRINGVCDCFPGYSGSSCSRLSCPRNETTGLECNGHGTCISAKELAEKDFNNIYKLWDQHATMSCQCDPSYDGPMCEKRVCKKGYDPIYWNQDNSHRYSNWSYVIYTKSSTAKITGNYSIQFYDYTDRKWETAPIQYKADCLAIIEALESLPNKAIEQGSVECFQNPENYNVLNAAQEPIQFTPTNPYYGIKTTVAFPSNPGVLRQPSINIYLDGPHPTLFSDESPVSTLDTFVYPDGFSGEEIDYFSHKCVGLEVSLSKFTSATLPNTAEGSVYYFITGLTAVESRLLAQCLGDSDGNEDTFSATGRVMGEDYSWDYGTKVNPHMVKLVDQTERPATTLCNSTFYKNKLSGETDEDVCIYHQDRSAGFYVPLYYDPVDDLFKLFTRAGADYSSLTVFTIYTTTSTMQLVSDYVKIYTSKNKPYSNMIYSINSTATNYTLTSEIYHGNIDCETHNPALSTTYNNAYDCIEKEHKIFLFDPSRNIYSYRYNPKYLNMYTVKKVEKKSRVYQINTDISGYNQITLDMSVNFQYLLDDHSHAMLYLFKPSEDTMFRYVSPCSNRGNCNELTGDCECFLGFAGDDCSMQNNIIS